MRLKFAIPLAIAAAYLPSAHDAKAVTYAETGDAGEFPAAAQIITNPVGYAATAAVFTTAITGATTATNGLYDGDMYQITIAYPATFTASNNFFVVGANNFDSQISLFTTAGVGIASNDDAASGGSQSTLKVTLAAGTYDLLISGSGRYGISAGGLIFPNYTDGTTDPSATVGPTGPGGAGALSAYTGATNEGGAYNISLSAIPAAIPEPSSLAAIASGIGGLALMLRRRRSK